VQVFPCATGFSGMSDPDRLALGKKQKLCEQQHVEELRVVEQMQF
jgi:hypothetical protein